MGVASDRKAAWDQPAVHGEATLWFANTNGRAFLTDHTAYLWWGTWLWRPAQDSQPLCCDSQMVGSKHPKELSGINVKMPVN